ncbi:bifunctional DnaJ domain/Immunoglobulin E-set/Sec63 domain/Chaperone J-domain superfamily/C2 domain superfamily/Translocation protein Sec63 [Babesia duncani]|uniref:Bifunctional DnaJ domain/Immunoglobulin E-set/Sec63 domain/Chaperone J-domain superfamily/C2 domain superfamily/Translocation protein Sec63 n=1 Tax=Babesia duncani TaxID=323732 RepID=A0AAD9PIT7_9APIC|nr:bifunctional DnaJ domain/Immunoglobulin E-set/Sec63 domain/Chaperone J-domain superfamily/C2 domain superfamily/Translocation protein Sec63 [Babesia duncani]
MSQFHETFTRAGKKDPLLSYDDFASRIFMSGFLTCFLLPITITLLFKWLRPRRNSLALNLRLSDVHLDDGSTKVFLCKCSLCRKRREKERQSSLLLQNWFSYSRVFQVILLAFFWFIVIYLIKGLLFVACTFHLDINVADNIKRFDPFALLGVATDATVKEIKRAYRHLSLKFHPDRNPNDPEMAAHFILITKAYKALTNEQSRRNYERYGNPDGPGMMKIGIGLPRFLVDEDNQVIILSIFFVVLLLVMPGVFLWYYNKQKLYASSGIRVDTLHLIYFTLNENTRHKNLPEIYSCSAECCEIPSNAGDDANLKRLLGNLGDFKRTAISRETFRNFVILLCHMNRNDELTENFKGVQAEILKYSMIITQCMIDICICKSWGLTLRSIIDFRRCLVQGLSNRRDALLQIPHFTMEHVGHVQKGKNATKSVSYFVNQSRQDRRGTVTLTPEELADVDAFCEFYPRPELSVKVYVADSQEIYLDDLLTVDITLKRNVPEGYELVGPVHAPHFPWIKYEEWFFILAYADHPDEILAFSNATSRQAEIKHFLQFAVHRPGPTTLIVTAACDSYFDCDVECSIEFVAKIPNVVSASEFKIHPEDLALDMQQSVLNKVLGDILGAESSDEEEEVYDD